MNEPSGKEIQTTRAENEEASTFQTIFFPDGNAVPIHVPDYQRAFSWEKRQIELFIDDLKEYQGCDKGYYFGHFIAEPIIAEQNKEFLEIVDGQQRITMFVLFLMVCQLRSKDAPANAYSLIKSFFTVSYDRKALETIRRYLGAFLEKNGHFDGKPPADEQIIEGLLLSKENFTRSQRRMVLALLRFHMAFQKRELDEAKIGEYITVVMNAQCSLHLARDKSVAVNIFELHNTRGVPLTTLEKVKAKLMKFVYDHDGEVEIIQDEFGQIYGMEERLAASSFRGEMEMEHLLRLHLRVIDDGDKKTAEQFNFPHTNDTADKLVEYVDLRLRHIDGDENKPKILEDVGVQYAINLAKEFKKSVRIVSEFLPAWDEVDRLVGDVLILEPELSCQFFLIICRRLEKEKDKADGRIGGDALLLWEKLLFTRDFHGEYHGKAYRDNFPKLFTFRVVDGEQITVVDEEQITNVIKNYLVDGFRPWDVTKGLQSIVALYLKAHQEDILNRAFYWHPWVHKMKYAIYKYEVKEKKNYNIREVVKGGISVEHILPQAWAWEWIVDSCGVPRNLSNDEKDKWIKDVGYFINGIGNLLLISQSANSSVGNKHPAKKEYPYSGGSYEEHNQNREIWTPPENWGKLIEKRGKDIFKFMLDNLADASEKTSNSPPPCPPPSI